VCFHFFFPKWLFSAKSIKNVYGTMFAYAIKYISHQDDAVFNLRRNFIQRSYKMDSHPITVVGVFEVARNAQHAIQELRKAGFLDDNIGVVSHSEVSSSDKSSAEGSLGTGAVTGSMVGAGAGGLWALGIAAGILPGIGPVVAGGLLVSILASAALGAATGGVAGALIGLGISEEDAAFYDSEFKAGRTVVTVKAAGRFEEARSILREAGAYDVETRPPLHATTI
jgi:hypothetical protein